MLHFGPRMACIHSHKVVTFFFHMWICFSLPISLGMPLALVVKLFVSLFGLAIHSVFGQSLFSCLSTESSILWI